MSYRPPGENLPFGESNLTFIYTEAYPQVTHRVLASKFTEIRAQDANAVSYLEWLAQYVLPQGLGQLHDGSNTTPHSEFLLPSEASQFPSPEPAQSADLAADVQAIEALGGVNSPGGTSPPCEHCGKTFGRLQELKRHSKQVHRPVRKCPINSCPYTWKRPDKIRAHLTKVHGSEFCPSVAEGVRALRGEEVFEFVNAYDFKMPDKFVPLSLPLEPSGESGPYLSEYCGCHLTGIVSSVGVVEQMVEEATA